MATYTITGTATFSTQALRDAARTRVDTAVVAYTLVNFATTFLAGITNPSTTVMTISYQLVTDDDDIVRNARRAIYDAWTLTGRPTNCWLSSNKVAS